MFIVLFECHCDQSLLMVWCLHKYYCDQSWSMVWCLHKYHSDQSWSMVWCLHKYHSDQSWSMHQILLAGAMPKLQFKFIWCQQTLSLHFTICIWLVLLLLCCVMSQSKNVTRLAITLDTMKDHNFH